MGKSFDLKSVCQHCQAVRRWRRDGSRNTMGLVAALDNLAHQYGLCLGPSLPNNQPSPDQEAELRKRSHAEMASILWWLARGDVVGTRLAEWWLVECQECRGRNQEDRNHRPVKEVDGSMQTLRA